MKKVMVLVFALAFVLAAGVFANMGGEGMEGGMMWSKADVKMENTADGVKIMVTAKDAKDAKEIKEIQEGSAKMAEMRAKMMKEKSEGKSEVEGMEGMWGHGTGMGMNPEMMHHMQKKMGIVFCFLLVMWSLLIILLAVTIILVIKKIRA